MRYFNAIRPNGTINQYPAYELDDFPWINVSRETLTETKGKRSRTFFELPITFDIESTTYIEGDRPQAFMYHWQMCIRGICLYGRTWEEWIKVMNRLYTMHLQSGATHVIYVHNLGYEFVYIRQMLSKWGEVEVFASQPRKPITVRVGEAFEFRCSWKLSNMSLYKFTTTELGCRYIKADGDLDYSVFRYPDTPLNDTEFGYCMSDVFALYHAILAKLRNENDNLATIPLTSTSYVRRECRAACKKDKSYYSMFQRQSMTPAVYTLLKEAGRGGDTAANRYLAGQIIGNVDSFDVKSSYPFQQLTQEFPMGRFYKHRIPESESEIDDLATERCLLFRACFNNLEIKRSAIDAYLPYSKALERPVRAKVANGRILKAEVAVFTITEIDWKIIKDCYTFEEVSITSLYTAKKGMLPEPLRNCIMDYFIRKCRFEIERCKFEAGTPEYEDLNYKYMRSKNRLNGIFGMTYTDIVHDIHDVDLNSGEWTKKRENIEEALENYYSNRNSFLVYAWGVWTTAHARNHLQKLIRIIGESSIYWDTDSDKGHVSRETLQKILETNRAIKKLCIDTGAWCKIDGKLFYLGIYEHDGHYKTFKTLGAKKYAYTDYNDKLHCTISGVAKSNNPQYPDGARELGTMDNFNAGFVFHEAGGSTLYYNDDVPFGEHKIRGKVITTGANVAIVESEYTLGITEEYAEIIGYNSYINN